MDHPIFLILDQDSRNYGADPIRSSRRSSGARTASSPASSLSSETPRSATTSMTRALAAPSRTPLERPPGTSDSTSRTARRLGNADGHPRRPRGARDANLRGSLLRRRRSFRRANLRSRLAQDRASLDGGSRHRDLREREPELEPPLLLELKSYGSPGLLPLEAQDTWQYEIGSRGKLAERLGTWRSSTSRSETRS